MSVKYSSETKFLNTFFIIVSFLKSTYIYIHIHILLDLFLAFSIYLSSSLCLFLFYSLSLSPPVSCPPPDFNHISHDSPRPPELWMLAAPPRPIAGRQFFISLSRPIAGRQFFISLCQKYEKFWRFYAGGEGLNFAVRYYTSVCGHFTGLKVNFSCKNFKSIILN